MTYVNPYICKGGCNRVTCNLTGTCLDCQRMKKERMLPNILLVHDTYYVLQSSRKVSANASGLQHLEDCRELHPVTGQPFPWREQDMKLKIKG